MKDTAFFKQAELLLEVLRIVAKHEVFALKGGTAINFFIRDLPRLSVDIDNGIADLPAVQWKLINIRKMSPKDHQKAVSKLKTYLEL